MCSFPSTFVRMFSLESWHTNLIPLPPTDIFSTWKTCQVPEEAPDVHRLCPGPPCSEAETLAFVQTTYAHFQSPITNNMQ